VVRTIESVNHGRWHPVHLTKGQVGAAISKKQRPCRLLKALLVIKPGGGDGQLPDLGGALGIFTGEATGLDPLAAAHLERHQKIVLVASNGSSEDEVGAQGVRDTVETVMDDIEHHFESLGVVLGKLDQDSLVPSG